jgi:bifunctional non-homologous end joining protein LigD
LPLISRSWTEKICALSLIERREKLRSLLPTDQRCPLQFSEHWDGSGRALFSKACAIGLEGIVSKRALSAYRSGPSKFWLKTKNVVESELILLGTDYDNEEKPIAYLGKEVGGELRFAGTAFLTLSGQARQELQECIEKLVTERPPVPQRVWRKPQWLKPEVRVRVKHLQGGDTLRHASVRGLAHS